MGANPKPSNTRSRALLCVMFWAACALGQTVRHHPVKETTDDVAPAVRQAEAAIEKQDYTDAERLLVPFVAANPKDANAWYDLGYVYKATERHPLAIDAYRKAVAANPNLYQSNLSLGLLLAQDAQYSDAAQYFKQAIKLMPSTTPATEKAQNWMALGAVEEASHPDDAVAAFRKAGELSPKDAVPHLRAARVLAAKKNVAEAESEYKAALKIDTGLKEAFSGLIDLYIGNNRAAEAAEALRDYSARFPDDPKAHLMLGHALLKSGETDKAIAEFDAVLKQSPGEVGLLHEVAALYASQKKFDAAAPRYADLVKAAPDNAQYHHQYGVVLMQLHKFPEAQEQLISALKLDGKLIDAYGELAVAAAENKQYPLAINVLDGRAKLAPETPATYFLRATSYDNLKAFPQAAENYHKFLDASNGQYPDNEWKARHRLIAIEPAGKKKKS